jgi:hypothetical protein
MWGATYDEGDGWQYDRRWPGFARTWLDAWTRTKQGDPTQVTCRLLVGEWDTDRAELETWPTPQDFGLGINVDWEAASGYTLPQEDRCTIALHLGFLVVTLTLWRRVPRA